MKIKPVYIMHAPNVADHFVQAVEEGIAELLSIAGASEVSIHNFGAWRNGSGDYNSIHWYLQRAKAASTRAHQLSADRLIHDLWNEPWQQQLPHYDVVLVDDDIYSGNCNWVLGIAISGFGTVLSSHRYGVSASITTQVEMLRTNIMHEMGLLIGKTHSNPWECTARTNA